MKPSNIFNDDNSSTSKYWSKSSIIRWNKECIDEAKSYMSLKMLAQLVISTLIFVCLGFFFISWLYPYSSPTTNQRHHTPDQDSLIIVNFNRNLSITNSTMTEEVSTQINRLQKTAFEASTTHQPSTELISHDEHVEEEPREDDDDVLLLTKKYVRLNFDSFSIRVRRRRKYKKERDDMRGSEGEDPKGIG